MVAATRSAYQRLILCLCLLIVLAFPMGCQHPQQLPREVLSVEWGEGSNCLGRRQLEHDGWRGPSAFTISDGRAYVVDRVNHQLKVWRLSTGGLEQSIVLPDSLALHPYDIATIGGTLFLAYHDPGSVSRLSRWDGASWQEVGGGEFVIDGWMQLEPGPDFLLVRVDEPSRETGWWGELNAAGVLVARSASLSRAPGPGRFVWNVVTPGTSSPASDTRHQELALLDAEGNVTRRATISSGTPTNVVCVLPDGVSLYVKSYPISDNPAVTLTRFDASADGLECSGQWSIDIPDSYRGVRLPPASDVLTIEQVSGGKYYEMMYTPDHFVLLEWQLN